MSNRRLRVVSVVVATFAIASAAAAVAISFPASYFPGEGVNEQHAETLVTDLSGDDPLSDLATHFPASDQDALTALVSECAPVAQAHPTPAVYAAIVPVSARVVLDASGLSRCDMYLSWSEGNGDDWSVHLTKPSPQDPLPTAALTPAS